MISIKHRQIAVNSYMGLLIHKKLGNSIACMEKPFTFINRIYNIHHENYRSLL
jgi:hypothetical protein